jgi:hypothetical protein
MTRHEQIGFSQRIQLEWLDYTTNLVLAGLPNGEIADALRDKLRNRLSVGGDPERGNREKALTILMKVWVTVPRGFEALRDEGLQLLQHLTAEDRIFVHWSQCMAVYPFFGAVAAATGRLLQLQATAGAAQVQRRLCEQFGERETVSRSARRILRAFADWGALLETGKKGIYRGTQRREVRNVHLAIWTVRAVLIAACGESRPLFAALRGPHLFPFDFMLPTVNELEHCEALEVTRHGLDQEIILGLRNIRSDAPG